MLRLHLLVIMLHCMTFSATVHHDNFSQADKLLETFHDFV